MGTLSAEQLAEMRAEAFAEKQCRLCFVPCESRESAVRENLRCLQRYAQSQAPNMKDKLRRCRVVCRKASSASNDREQVVGAVQLDGDERLR